MGGPNLRRIAMLAVVAVTLLALGWGSASLLGRETPGALASGLPATSGMPLLAPRGLAKVSNSGSLTPRSDLKVALLMLSVLVAASLARRRPQWRHPARSGAWPSLVRRRHSITLRAPPAVRHL